MKWKTKMDKHLEESGCYQTNKNSKIKCKNFSVCGNYIPKHLLKECEQANGDYLCPDYIQELDSEEIRKKRKN